MKPDAVKLETLAEELAQEDAAFEKRVSKYNRLASLWEVNARKHVWEKDDKGDVDTFAMEYGNHNGPSCEICDHSFCEHCHSFAEEEAKPCPGPTKPTKSRVHELLEILNTRTPSTTASTEGEKVVEPW